MSVDASKLRAGDVILVPNWAGQFHSYQNWVNKASSWLTNDDEATGSCGEKVSAICVDALGRRCNIGKDFMRARDENAFPVRYFWSLTPVPLSTFSTLSALTREDQST